MRVMVRIFSILSLLAALVGGLYFVATFAVATSAPQEAAGFAGALAFAVIPYCVLRSLEIFHRARKAQQ